VSALDVVGAAGLGIALGAVTGIPIGVVNVAIVESATRGDRRHAIAIGIGGALADAAHAAVAFVGVGHVVAAHPQWTKGLAIGAAAIVVAYAVTAMRRRSAMREGASTPGRFGIATGVLLTLPNPAALGAWIAVAAAIWPGITLVPALTLAAGVGVGSAAWFTVLARFVAGLPADHRVVRALPPIALTLLVVIAGVGIVRVLVGGF
jgi:threonine/homoserine/homoserine lactone efflux protein